MYGHAFNCKHELGTLERAEAYKCARRALHKVATLRGGFCFGSMKFCLAIHSKSGCCTVLARVQKQNEIMYVCTFMQDTIVVFSPGQTEALIDHENKMNLM